MKFSLMFPSRFIRAADLEGKSFPLVIEKIECESVVKDEDPKPVIYFRGGKKGLVCNQTNAAVLALNFGDDTDGWIGKTVILYPTKTQFAGKLVDALRLRLPEISTPVAKPRIPEPLIEEVPDLASLDIPF